MPGNDSAKVLVTYGWCRTAYVAVRSLARLGFEVYACSHQTPSMCSWSRYSRSSARVADPFTTPEAFVRDISRLVKRWSIDVILPGHEDALVLRRLQSKLPAGVAIASPSRQHLELAVDKARLTKAVAEAGVPTPRTGFPHSIGEALASAGEIGFPVIVKLRRSNSGKGVAAAHTPGELTDILHHRFARFTGSREHFPIVQALLSGQVVGACFLADQGRVVAVFGERYLRCKESSFGTSVFREPLVWSRLIEHVTKVVQCLQWSGLGHLDFIQDPTSDEAFVLELNPRLWGAINLAFINGYDFAGAAVAQATGEDQLERFFRTDKPPSLRSIWLVGELISGVNRWQAGDRFGPLRAIVDVLRALPRSRFDDLVWHDPLGFIAELGCYAKQFVRSGGNTNPSSEGMLG